VLSPALLFGKGLGDLPEALAYLRPLAVTGIFGAEVPLTSKEGNSLTYGVAIEYSLPYLQQFVKDIGIPAAAGRFFPVVELLFSTPIDARAITPPAISSGGSPTGSPARRCQASPIASARATAGT
jgi:hypothetical protein